MAPFDTSHLNRLIEEPTNAPVKFLSIVSNHPFQAELNIMTKNETIEGLSDIALKILKQSFISSRPFYTVPELQ